MSDLPPLTRGSLLARLADPKDRAAWEEFVEVYGELVYRDVCRRGITDPDCDDVTQLVFVRLLAALPSFHYQPEKGRFRDWLGTVIRFEVSRYRRDNGRRKELATDPSFLEHSVDAEADAEWSNAFQTRVLRVALERSRGKFEPQTWQAFLQVWANNRPVTEVAAEFGQSVDWVYVAKSRALKIVSEHVRLLMDGFPFGEG